jgi:adhesin transport system outer membrane protein
MERASNLPGLKATGSVGTGGNSLGVNLASDKLFGLGTGATLQAIEATKEGAQRLVAQAREDSNRRLRKMEAQLKGVQRQVRESNALTSQSKKNLDLFQMQYKHGTRQVMDVVGVYETYARQQKKTADLKYKAALLKLQIANEMGLLASGASI